MIILVAICAGTATYSISYLLNKGPVFASALVTLISGIFLPYFLPENGPTLMAVAACASYAGQASNKNVPNLREMIMVSLITGALFIIFSTSYVGIGGRLGSIAAISCFTWMGIKKVFKNDNLQDNKISYINKVNFSEK